MLDFLSVIWLFGILKYPSINWVKKGQKKAIEGLKKALKAKQGCNFLMKTICKAVKYI